MHTPTEDAIRDRAYALWVEAGSPEGNELHFWHQAEQQLAFEADTDQPKTETVAEAEAILPGGAQGTSSL